MEEVIGDGAYSGQDNLENAGKEHIVLIAKLNPIVSNGRQSERDGFTFNKDAGMMVCPAGHMAKYKNVTKRYDEKRKNNRIRFIFDREKCSVCKYAEECGFKGGRYGKQYTVSILSKEQEVQLREQETQEFKEKDKERYIGSFFALVHRPQRLGFPWGKLSPKVTDEGNPRHSGLKGSPERGAGIRRLTEAG